MSAAAFTPDPSGTDPSPVPEPGAPASPEGTTGGPESRVLLISRPGCHLCDDAREVVREVTLDTGTEWAEVSIDDDAELAARYGEEIPVVLIDGVQHAFWRVDAGRLRSALTGGE